MPFQPTVNQEITIEQTAYRVAEHPAAPGMTYGQEGRQAVVYQLTGLDDAKRALKVFKPRYRMPMLAALSERMASFAGLPGLQVWQRSVLMPKKHGALLSQYPDLTYAVLMPWIEGPTWLETILEKRALTTEQALTLARALVTVLVGIEQRGAAHCDLSGSNILIPLLAPSAPMNPRAAIALVDVEQFFAPKLERPDLLPGGSAGYAHKTATNGLWSAEADRFAGAILVAEMLGWCDESVRSQAYGESFFDPAEIQQDSTRYDLLKSVLCAHWSNQVADLFGRAWTSDTPADCPTFGEWMVMLPEVTPISVATQTSATVSTQAIENAVQTLLSLAQQLLAQGNRSGALDTCWRARDLVPAGSALQQTVLQKIHEIESPPPAETAPVTTAPSVAAIPAADAPTAAPTESPTQVVVLPWSKTTASDSRTRLLWSFVAVFAGVGVLLLIAVPVFHNLIYAIGNQAARSGEGARQAIASGFLATLVGGVQVWIFRQRIQNAQHRLLFLLAATLGGIIGGIVGGTLMQNRAIPSASVGIAIGAVAGAVAGVCQNLLMRSHGAEIKWFLWNLISWAIIWLIGWNISWNVTGINGTAFGSAFILAATGAALAFFLHNSPEIEF
jgi:hypothetical protein